MTLTLLHPFCAIPACSPSTSPTVRRLGGGERLLDALIECLVNELDHHHSVDDLHVHFFCSCSRCPSLEAFSLQIPIETVTGWIEEAALAMDASEGAAAALAAETAPPASAQSGAADAAAAEEAPSDTSGNTGHAAEAENRMHLQRPQQSQQSKAKPRHLSPVWWNLPRNRSGKWQKPW